MRAEEGEGGGAAREASERGGAREQRSERGEQRKRERGGREGERLGGAASSVFLGGLSQGCTAALDVYMREGPTLGLGGFVGSVGFLPSDADGFEGADEAVERFLADPVQSRRPLWLQSAKDDQWVPWGDLVEPSLRRLRGRATGLRHRTVRGRGHVIEEWEGDLLNEFVREHAGGAF